MVNRGWKPEVLHGCVQKVRHEDQAAAQVAMIETAGEALGQVYPCPFCDGWHWGRVLTHPEWPDHVVRDWRQWAQLQRRVREKT